MDARDRERSPARVFAIHPLTLRFTDDACERELRASCVSKIVTFTGVLALFATLVCVGMLLQGRQVVWVCVLCIGLAKLYHSICLLEAYRAHRLFEKYLCALLGLSVSAHVSLGLLQRHYSQAEEAGQCLLPFHNRNAPEAAFWPLVTVLLLSLAWSLCTWWLHFTIRAKVFSLCLPLLGHALNPMYPELGGTQLEVQVVSTAFCAGTFLGYFLERTAREAFLQHKEKGLLELRLVQKEADAMTMEMRALANRVINHTSKRVMCNTVQLCDSMVKRLSYDGNDQAHAEMIAMLKAHAAESITGFHMCQSVLLRTNICAKQYKQKEEVFSLNELFSDLGYFTNPRIECSITRGSLPFLHDKLLLQTILFNATQNALTHGRAGAKIKIDGSLNDVGMLSVTIYNEPGMNHDRLRDLQCDDLISSQFPLSELTNNQLGTRGSTYLGLQDIRMVSDIVPNCSTSLRVLQTGVVFELTINHLVRRRPSTIDMPCPPSQLVMNTTDRKPRDQDCSKRQRSDPGSPTLNPGPHDGLAVDILRGVTIIHADDDLMPRMFMESALECMQADPTSLILGERYDELLSLPQNVASIANARGHERVIVILDRCLELPGWPVVDGLELCRALRGEQGFRGLIIILSANDETEAVDAALGAGADGFAPKSVHSNLQRLTSMLAQLYGEKHGTDRAGLATQQKLPSP